MDNPEEVLHSLDEFAKLKPKSIPRELEDYLTYVARTGDPVYQWPVVKCLFREKLLNVITEFYETTPTLDLTPSPNVDPFNYESMKNVLVERLEAFSNAPFTVQRLCELLTTPRKEYNRPDKFMRAIEKNILVVSTREPGSACRPDSALSEPIPNGVSEPPDAANNQPSSSEERIEEASDASHSKESVENHVVAESLSTEQPNHIDSEQSEPSLQVTEEAKASEPEEIRENIVKEDTENHEATDVSENLSKADVSCESAEIVKEDVTLATDTSSEVSATPETSADLPEQPTALPEQSSSPAVESNEIESVPIVSSSPETSNSADDVQETVEDAVSTEQDLISEAEVKEATIALDTPAADRIQESSEAAAEPEPSDLPDECTKTSEDKEDTPQEETTAPIATESPVSSAQQEQLADSTATDAENEKVVPVPEAVSSDSTDQITSEAVTDAKQKPVEREKLDVVDGSEATPVLEKTESDAKEIVDVVKADVDARITSTEETNDEDMEVDESSNQPSESAEADAMEVAEEDEPMEVCEDSTLEEMTTSPQEVILKASKLNF